MSGNGNGAVANTKLGLLLIGAGVVGFAYAAIFGPVPGTPDSGGLPAVSMFLIIIGLVFYFPRMLEDDTHSTSTMRVTVLMIVSLFVILTLKAGWSAGDLEQLKVDQSWAWILAAALGGKVFQSFSENK